MCLHIIRESAVRDRIGYKVFRIINGNGAATGYCGYGKYRKLYPNMLIVARHHKRFPVGSAAVHTSIDSAGVHGYTRLGLARRRATMPDYVVWRCMFINSVTGICGVVRPGKNKNNSLAAPVVKLLRPMTK
jgi:hypothetical protein